MAKMDEYMEEKRREYQKAIESHLFGTTDINHKGEYGRTALHKAVSCDFAEFVSDLIQKGADVNVQDINGFTPLHFAITNDNIYATKVKLLLAAGANPNIKSNFGETPLFWAARWGEGAIETVIYGHGGLYGIDSFDAVARGDLKQLAAMLAKEPALVNTKASGFTTPCAGCLLGLAIRWGQKEAVELLISKGAELNNIGRDGMAPLHVAVFWGRREIVKLLVENGGQINIQNKRGETPLDMAVKFKRGEDIAELLRKHGAKTGEKLKSNGK